MTELYHLAFSATHLPYTILLMLIVLYWLTVILGAIDLDFLDFDIDAPEVDVDVDIDVDIDADVDADMDSDVQGGGGFFINTLAFFNIGKVPFMIFLSMFILALWVSSIANFELWGSTHTSSFFLIWLVPNMIIGLFAAKLLTQPFKGSFEKMNQTGRTKKELVGKIGEVVMQVSQGKMGRIEVYDNDEHFSLDVAVYGEKSIGRGEKAIIVEYDQENDLYTVEPF